MQPRHKWVEIPRDFAELNSSSLQWGLHTCVCQELNLEPTTSYKTLPHTPDFWWTWVWWTDFWSYPSLKQILLCIQQLRNTINPHMNHPFWFHFSPEDIIWQGPGFMAETGRERISCRAYGQDACTFPSPKWKARQVWLGGTFSAYWMYYVWEETHGIILRDASSFYGWEWTVCAPLLSHCIKSVIQPEQAGLCPALSSVIVNCIALFIACRRHCCIRFNHKGFY